MSYETLTDLIAKVQPEQQFTVYKRFKAAVRSGDLDAVPVHGTVQIHRAKSPLGVPEHAIKEGSQEWLSTTLEEMKKPRSSSRRLSVQISDLESGKIDFAQASAKYRASLQRKGAKRGRRKEG